MTLSSFHLIIKQCFNQWRTLSFRTFVVINQRQLSTIENENKDSKRQEKEILVQSQNNQIQITTFTQKVQQVAKDTIYSLVVVAGVVALGGLCYLILHELYSRETPNGIYKEASKICLANTDVQEALVQKNICNKFVYDYILVQLDQPWHNQNIIQVHSNVNPPSFTTKNSSS
ncbi:unnamed protein product [Rotaria sp. Silwood1]|nr:unnamed protein product [Rotaria sp. Silwood1]